MPLATPSTPTPAQVTPTVPVPSPMSQGSPVSSPQPLSPPQPLSITPPPPSSPPLSSGSSSASGDGRDLTCEFCLNRFTSNRYYRYHLVNCRYIVFLFSNLYLKMFYERRDLSPRFLVH